MPDSLHSVIGNIQLSPKGGRDSVGRSTSSSVEDGATEGLNEPKLGVVAGDLVELAHLSASALSLGDSVSGSLENNGEVHAENTSGGVVLNSEINMLVNAKSEVTL